MIEKTFVMVKPDGVQRQLAGKIISRFEDAGLKIVGMKMKWIDKEFAGKLYSAHLKKEFYKGLEKFITESPVIAFVIEGLHAVEAVRKIVGATEPRTAAPGTIRGDFGHHSFQNLIHASDSVENAETAIKDAIINDYDRTVFISGPGALSLAERGDAKALAVETLAAGKILGAICIAPVILARAGVLNGRRATVWDSDGEQAALLKASGAIYTGEAVTVDRKIVTGNGPMAAEVFGKTFAELRIDTTSRLKRS